MSKKLPHLQLYTGDWLKDQGLLLVSYAAKGLWIDLLCHMSESPERGFLVNRKGRAYSDEEIATILGKPLSMIQPLLDELEEKEVFSRDSRGAMYSRRIHRDEKRREQNEKNGTRGGRPRRQAPVVEEQTGVSPKPTFIEERVEDTEKNNRVGYLETKPTPDNDNDIENEISLDTTSATTTEEGGVGETISLPDPLLEIPSSVRISDPMWIEFLTLAQIVGMAFGGKEAEGYRRGRWNFWDLDKRLRAMVGIQARVESGEYADPGHVHTLENYLSKEIFERPVRPRPKPQSAVYRIDRKAAASEEFDRRIMRQALEDLPNAS
jgi:hypothetical protein